MMQFSTVDLVFIVILLSLSFWPVSLVLGALAAAWGVQVRGAGRAALFGFAALCALHCLGAAALWQARRADQARAAAYDAELDAEYQRTHRTLTQPETIEGLAFPPGTVVGWTDAGHTRLKEFELPGPTPLFGATLDWRATDEQGHWTVHLAAASVIDGWPCQAGYNVQISHEGHLVSCQLAADRMWRGRLVPAATYVQPGQDGVSLNLPSERPLDLPELGLVAHNSLTLNPDGSVHTIYVEPEDDYAVQGVPLWNSVTFRYPEAAAAATPPYPAPVSVNGALSRDTAMGDETVRQGTGVTVQWATGATTIEGRICGRLSPLRNAEPC